MLHTETVAPATLDLLKRLMFDTYLSKFVLVGGTALSLQLGHRMSIDLDLFINESYNENELVEYLRENYLFELDFLEKETVKGEIKGVAIDCIAHKYPWVNETIEIEGVRIAGLADIAAMKLNAIAGNGTRIKDFIDIAYLSSKITLNEMLSAYEKKYRSNPVLTMKALSYYDDINFKEPIRMIGKSFDWITIKKRIEKMLKYPEKVFE